MNQERKWLSVPEIESELERYEHGTELGRFYALSRFWRESVYPETYESSTDWPKILVLSDYGHSIWDLIESVQEVGSESEVLFVLFRIFTYHHILFDPKSSNIGAVEGVLRSELQDEKILLPFRYGRLLYDRFNDNYDGERTEHLVTNAVKDLLAGTPKGVYQLDKYLTGPLGLLYSRESRYLPPSLYLPLWHCSDTGCLASHNVEFLPPEVPLTKLDYMVKQALKEKLGPPSEWSGSLTGKYVARRASEERPFTYCDLPIFVAESIIGRERTMLLTRALEQDTSKELRAILSTPPRRKNAGDGKPEEVATRLSSEEQLQLLLVLPDAVIVDLVDQLTESGALSIPHGQTRTARQELLPSSLSIPCELSRLGMRSTREPSIVTLVSFIYSAYTEQELQGDLQWRLRASVGIPLKEALVGYVREKGPKLAIQELVLSSPKIAKYVCKQLCLSLDRMASKTDDAVDRVLWKMGFNPPQYDDFCERFASHLDRFNQAVLSTPSLKTEDEREAIRAAGVNLFVYLERFIENLISYNVWLLSSDHFLVTQFHFNLNDAREQVKRVLGATLTNGDVSVSWDTQGENSLGVLLAYLGESLRWIESMQTAERDNLRRSEADIPHFAEVLKTRFPFYHTELWADCDPTQFRSYRDRYALIVSLLQKAELAYVRNGLDHMRDASRFPKIDTMLAFVSRIREAYTTAVVRRYLAEVWWFERAEKDRFGMITYYLNNVLGHSLVLHGPEMLQCLPGIPTDAPVLVAPENLLGEPNASLTFSLRDVTEYDLYWRGYPRRRRIVSDSSAIPCALQNNFDSPGNASVRNN